MVLRLKSIIIVLFAGSLLAGCRCPQSGDEWGVLLGAIPKRVSVKDADQTIAYYLLKQTHEPLFRQDDGSNYQSRLLKKWSRNISSTQFTFCPDTTLAFDKRSYFSMEYFYGYLRDVTAKYTSDFAVSKQTECAVVSFSKPQLHYFDFLTRYENSPTISESVDVESGLGPYNVQFLSEKKAVLLRKKRVANGYNKITAYAYAGPGDPNLGNKYISDFNRITSYDQPQWIKEEYVGFSNLELKSLNIIINHPDKEVRRQLYNCLDLEEFRKAFTPRRRDFYDIKTLLPIGVSGALPGKPLQTCSLPLKPPGGVDPVIVLLNQQWDNKIQLQDFIARFKKKTGIEISILQPPQQKLVEMLHSPSHPYNLAVVVTGTYHWDYSAFFKYYAGESTYFNYVPQKIKMLYKKILTANPEEKSVAAVELAAELIKESMVLTLYQTSVKLYYPKNIKTMSVGRGFVEIPEVADFRW